MVEYIMIAELKRLSNINIIDVRSIEKYNDNHILNAINAPFDKILIYPEKYMNKYEKYYLYCQKGYKTKQLCRILNQKGYHTVHIIGGYEAWILNE